MRQSSPVQSSPVQSQPVSIQSDNITMVAASLIKFKGIDGFRQKLVLATLAQKVLKITNIRDDPSVNHHPGLADYEISFLRLLEKLTNGCSIQISHTGTSLVYKPGVIIGGVVHHECPNSRAIGYFLEPLIALAPFSKLPFSLTLTGVTNNNLDVSADTLRTCFLPQLKRYGIADGLEMRITKRGAAPLGGGEIVFSCPIVKELKPCIFTDEGKIKRIRGIAYATRVSPQIANRIMEASRGMLTRYIPDVYVYTDVYKGLESGRSPGYALTLVAETTTGALLSAECAFEPKPKEDEHNASVRHMRLQPIEQRLAAENFHFQTPEDLGTTVARMLLTEIEKGGCVDSTCQWLAALFAAIGPEDVGKIRVGPLTEYTIQYLRDIKTFLNVTFNIEPQDDHKGTFILTCLGSGYANVNKKLS